MSASVTAIRVLPHGPLVIDLVWWSRLFRWVPPIAIAASTWYTSGLSQLASTVPFLKVQSGVVERNLFIQQADFVATVVFVAFAFAAHVRIHGGILRAIVPLALALVGYLAVGFVSTVASNAPFDAVVASLASMIRLPLYALGITLVPLGGNDADRTRRVFWTIAVANAAIVALITVVYYLRGGDTAHMPNDQAVGLFGFANDATLLGLIAMVAALCSSWAPGRRLLWAGVFFAVAFFPVFNFGLVVGVVLLPAILIMKYGDVQRAVARVWFIRRRFLQISVAIALAIFGLTGFVLTSIVAADVPAYTGYIPVIKRTPGFVAGLGVVLQHFEHVNTGIALVGEGPGRVNSRPVSRLAVEPAIPGIVVATATFTPFTYDQMNQSYLVLLAETGFLGLISILLAWVMLIRWMARGLWVVADNRTTASVAFGLFYGLCLLFILGVVSIYWQESSTGYWVLCLAAPYLALGSRQ